MPTLEKKEKEFLKSKNSIFKASITFFFSKKTPKGLIKPRYILITMKTKHSIWKPVTHEFNGLKVAAVQSMITYLIILVAPK